ncbi:MAG: sulfotransferase [Planctomycetota bacterium]
MALAVVAVVAMSRADSDGVMQLGLPFLFAIGSVALVFSVWNRRGHLGLLWQRPRFHSLPLLLAPIIIACGAGGNFFLATIDLSPLRNEDTGRVFDLQGALLGISLLAVAAHYLNRANDAAIKLVEFCSSCRRAGIGTAPPSRPVLAPDRSDIEARYPEAALYYNTWINHMAGLFLVMAIMTTVLARLAEIGANANADYDTLVWLLYASVTTLLIAGGGRTWFVVMEHYCERGHISWRIAAERWSRIWMGADLQSWRQIRERGGAAVLARQRILIGSSSVISTIGDAVARRRVEPGSFLEAHKRGEVELVLIVGHWRSGTTLLHELLAKDSNAIAPTNWQCFMPHLMPIMSRPWVRSLMPVALPEHRPMDSMPMTWDRPQEDEFALMCMGSRSPYIKFAYPERFQTWEELRPEVELDAADRGHLFECLHTFLDRVWTYWRDMRDATGRPCGQGRLRMILKSPPHGWRLRHFERSFPGATYLNIFRSPEDVFASTKKLWIDLSRHQCVTSFHASPEYEVQLSAFVLDCGASLLAAIEDFHGQVDDRWIDVPYSMLDTTVASTAGDAKSDFAVVARLAGCLGKIYELRSWSQGAGYTRTLEEEVRTRIRSHRKNIHALDAVDREAVIEQWGRFYESASERSGRRWGRSGLWLRPR